MMLHLLKLVWARKGANLLLIVEIFFSFIVVFAVAMATVSGLRRAGTPLGFSYHDVYRVSTSFADLDNEQKATDSPERTGAVLHELEAIPQVEAAAAAMSTPFEQMMATTVIETDGRVVSTTWTELSDDADEVLGLQVVSGRWFEPADDVFDWTPVVINRALAEQAFPGQDPIGKWLDEDGDQRVVGMVEQYRRAGELQKVGSAMITRLSSEKPNRHRPTRFLIKVAPGTTAAFEREVLRRVRGVAPQWTLTMEPLESTRRQGLKMAMAPMVVGGGVAASLMLMVMLGMVGVFWQAVTTRKEEIGLRRALGGSRGSLCRQFLLEIVLLTTVGAGLAVVIVLQLPLLGVLGEVSWLTFGSALALAVALLYGLALGSGLYPALLAARVEPAAALHDE